MQFNPAQINDSQQMAEQLELTRILEQALLYPHFQPIINLQTGHLFGYEALIRGPEDSPLHRPYALFQAALQAGRELELEHLCRQRSLEVFARLGSDATLFLNVSAAWLASPAHQPGFTLDLLRRLGIPQQQVVIELSEQHPFDTSGLTRRAVEHYRSMGFRIAIDDLGTGYSDLKLWSELQPEYVKIDQHFIRDLDRNPVKREFVRSIARIGRSLRCQVLAEGIEQMSELRALQALGVPCGQGYLLGYPQARPEVALMPQQIRPPLHRRSGQVFRRAFWSRLPGRSLLGLD
jgi:EAL domain-containing protein (putative c-di-GMP-specific phosphodiesterase class I)